MNTYDTAITGDNNYQPRSNDHTGNHIYSPDNDQDSLAPYSARNVTPSRTTGKQLTPTRPPLLSEMDEQTAKKAILHLTWQYLRTVVLQFLVEEGSQYPFWASKVRCVLCTVYCVLCAVVGVVT